MLSMRERAGSMVSSVQSGARSSARNAALVVLAAGLHQPRLRNIPLWVDWFAEPTSADVVGNYVRGKVLFGTPDAKPFDLVWRAFATRAIITPASSKLPKRLRPIINRSTLEARYDEDFESIVEGCRHERGGTWITDELIGVYRDLRDRGLTTSLGMYREGRLVSGLWGLRIGRVFGLMSMFHTEDNAGSLAQAALASQIGTDRRWDVVDVGLLTENFVRFGAFEISAPEFCDVVLAGMRGS